MVLKKIKRDFDLLKTFAKMEAMTRLQDVWGFCIMSIGLLFETAITIIFFKSIFLNVEQIGFWSFSEVLVLVGTFLLINNIAWSSYIRGFHRLPRLIDRGDFDLLILKPIELRKFISLKWIDLVFSLPIILASIAIIVYGIMNGGNIFLFPQYIFFVICAIVIHFSVVVMISTINFWHIIPDLQIAIDEMAKLGKYPITIYRGFFRLFFSIVFPLLFMYSIPAQSLFGTWQFKNMILTLIFTVFFYSLSTVVWKFALKRYESAKG